MRPLLIAPTFKPEPGKSALRMLAERFDGDEWKVYRVGNEASGQLVFEALEVEPSVEADRFLFVEAMGRDLRGT